MEDKKKATMSQQGNTFMVVTRLYIFGLKLIFFSCFLFSWPNRQNLFLHAKSCSV